LPLKIAEACLILDMEGRATNRSERKYRRREVAAVRRVSQRAELFWYYANQRKLCFVSENNGGGRESTDRGDFKLLVVLGVL
jgi:hypothetical protein